MRREGVAIPCILCSCGRIATRYAHSLLLASRPHISGCAEGVALNNETAPVSRRTGLGAMLPHGSVADRLE
jgi:hypothetical protein